MTATDVVTSADLQFGDAAQIQHFEQIFRAQGIYHGPVDGRYNPEFIQALQHWQTAQGLPVTGNLDFASTAHMNAQMQALSGGGAKIDPKVRQLVISQYGAGMAAYLSTSMGPAIVAAAQHRETTDELFGRLSQTPYWQQTSQAARQWDQLTVTDPAEAHAQLGMAQASVTAMAHQLGLRLTTQQLRTLSEDAARFGWTSSGNRQVLTDIMVNTLKADPVLMQAGGSYASALDSAKAAAASYLIKTTDAGSADLAGRLASGEITDKEVNDYYQRQAEAMFAHQPDIVNILKTGTTLAQYLDPYKQTIAKELDISPDAVDFINDKRWSGLLHYQGADGKGQPRMATLDEAAQVARQQPQWWSTTNGRAAGATMALGIARGFGIQV